MNHQPPLRPLALFLALLICTAAPVRAGVVFNEVLSAGSQRALQWSAAGPFGFGSFTNASPAPVIATNVATQMQNLTPTLYLRKTFPVSAPDAARTDPLVLEVQFNDGFICYINGIEVARQNAGPVNGFAYHDQFAAFGTPANSEVNTTPYLLTLTTALPAANTRLVAGTNVVPIQVLHQSEPQDWRGVAASAGDEQYDLAVFPRTRGTLGRCL